MPEPTIRLSAFGELTATEMAELARGGGVRRTLVRGETLWREGERLPGLFVLLEGWTAGTLFIDGGGRQLIKVHMPGDLLGLPSLALESAVETMTALNAVTLIQLPLHALRRLFELQPRVAAILFLVSQEERVHLIDRLAAVGRTSTLARVAAVIAQLHQRVKRSVPDTGDTFYLPLTQNDLADLVGVSTVHINRTLKQLSDMRVLQWSRQRVTILDAAALQECAGMPVRQLAHDQSWLPKPA